MDFNTKFFKFAFAALVLVIGIGALTIPYFSSFDSTIKYVENIEPAPEKCAAGTEKQDCPAKGPIISAPYYVNGMIQGYLVYPGENPDVFDSTGLLFGDLVTAVEGQPLTNVELMNKLLGSLSSGQSIQVTVKREGVHKVIDLLAD